MYLEHFGLKEPPFRLTPDPQFLFPSRHHSRAKAYMESTVLLDDGFVIITGEIGSGKTTLIQSFIAELGDDVVLAHVKQTQLSPAQFLQTLLADLGISAFDKQKAELLDLLNQYLVQQYAAGRKVVLIVDEAQNLSSKVLEEVRLLSGIETTKEKVLRIILAGQPELRDKLKHMTQLMQRVRLKFHLGPLNKDETQAYIRHRLAVAGAGEREIFDAACFPVIYRQTRGIPRLVNNLCDTALICAFVEKHATVGIADIEAALAELQWEESTERTDKMRTAGADNDGSELLPDQTRLVITFDDKIIRELDLPAGRTIIGRTPDNDIQLDNSYVSRHHAQIVITEDGCYIEDLNSTNGLYLGQDRVKKHELKSGDVVTLGKHELSFEGSSSTLRTRRGRVSANDAA